MQRDDSVYLKHIRDAILAKRYSYPQKENQQNPSEFLSSHHRGSYGFELLPTFIRIGRRKIALAFAPLELG